MSLTRQLHVLDIPRDILVSLPEYLHDVEDFMNLSSTCRALRSLYASTSPRTIFHLCVAATRIFFRPSPHFLIAAVAEQLAEWASDSQANVDALRESFKGGVDGLLRLCLQHCGITMERVRELHRMRYTTINPLADIIDKCAGAQWYSTPNFWSGGVSDAATVHSDPPVQVFHIAIYGGLFGPTLRAFLSTGSLCTGTNGVIVGDAHTRLEYLKYCIPNENDNKNWDDVGDCESEAQYALLHLLFSKKFNRHLTSYRALAGPEFCPISGWSERNEAERVKQRVWQAVAITQGIDRMRLMFPEKNDVGEEEDRNRSQAQRELIAQRDAVGKLTRADLHLGAEFWSERTYKFPFITGDIAIARWAWGQGPRGQTVTIYE